MPDSLSTCVAECLVYSIRMGHWFFAVFLLFHTPIHAFSHHSKCSGIVPLMCQMRKVVSTLLFSAMMFALLSLKSLTCFPSSSTLKGNVLR